MQRGFFIRNEPIKKDMKSRVNGFSYPKFVMCYLLNSPMLK